MIKKLFSFLALLGLVLAPTHSQASNFSSKDACYLGALVLSAGVTGGAIYTLYQERQKHDKKEQAFQETLENKKKDHEIALTDAATKFNTALADQLNTFNENQAQVAKQMQEQRSNYDRETSDLRTSFEQQLQAAKDEYTAKKAAMVEAHQVSKQEYLQSTARFQTTAAEFLRKQATFDDALKSQEATFQSELERIHQEHAQEKTEHESALQTLKDAHTKNVKERVQQFTLAVLVACAHMRGPDEQRTAMQASLEFASNNSGKFNEIFNKYSLPTFTTEDLATLTSLKDLAGTDNTRNALEFVTKLKQQQQGKVRDALEGRLV